MPSKKIIWITWESQIRNKSMTSLLGVPLFEILSGKGRLARYAECIRRTLAVLRDQKPDVVVCQNPSLVLTILLLRLRRVFGFRLVIDAHFGGVESYNNSPALQRVLDACNRSANLVIVTNPAHAQIVSSAGGRAFVCPDPLPDLSKYTDKINEVERKCFFICSYDVDEPYLEAFRAADLLWEEGFRLVVSGDYSKVGIYPSAFPRVSFLGYVPTDEYYRELFSAQVIIDLTEHANCLVCGAYEAMAAGKPLILSKQPSLEEYFGLGTVFAHNEATSIARAVRHAYAHYSQLAGDVAKWTTKARLEGSARIATLSDRLQEL